MSEETFDDWWRDEGSSMRPLEGEDAEKHAERMCRIAWSNGAYCEKYKQERS